jgi:hypothetical protein
MPIFIPVFLFLFVLIPILLAKMAADLLGLRGWRWRMILLGVIGLTNWQMWQVPAAPPAGQVAPVAAQWSAR